LANTSPTSAKPKEVGGCGANCHCADKAGQSASTTPIASTTTRWTAETTQNVYKADIDSSKGPNSSELQRRVDDGNKGLDNKLKSQQESDLFANLDSMGATNLPKTNNIAAGR
jgi:hypothetical protein